MSLTRVRTISLILAGMLPVVRQRLVPTGELAVSRTWRARVHDCLIACLDGGQSADGCVASGRAGPS